MHWLDSQKCLYQVSKKMAYNAIYQKIIEQYHKTDKIMNSSMSWLVALPFNQKSGCLRDFPLKKTIFVIVAWSTVHNCTVDSVICALRQLMKTSCKASRNKTRWYSTSLV